MKDVTVAWVGGAPGAGAPPKMSRKILTAKAPTSGPSICIIWIFFSRFLKHFSLATLARLHSIKFMFPKIEIWACKVTSKSDYIFYIFGFVVIDSIKLHIKCTKIVCGWEFARLKTENGIKCTHNVLSAWTLCLGLAGIFRALP